MSTIATNDAHARARDAHYLAASKNDDIESVGAADALNYSTHAFFETANTEDDFRWDTLADCFAYAGIALFFAKRADKANERYVNRAHAFRGQAARMHMRIAMVHDLFAKGLSSHREGGIPT